MSRRIAFFTLAASATLIATQAVADRECFENSCRLPEAINAPIQAAPSPVVEQNATPEGAAAKTADPNPAGPNLAGPEAATAATAGPAAVGPKIHMVHGLAPASEHPKIAAEPSRQLPVMTPSPVAEVEPESEPVRLVRHRAEPHRADENRTRRREATYAQADTLASTGAIAGAPLAVGPVIVAIPGLIYPGYALRPIYTIAPNAKIISIDSDD